MSRSGGGAWGTASRGVATLLSEALDFVYPPVCLVCDGWLPRGEDLVCASCWDAALRPSAREPRVLAPGVVAEAALAPGPTLFAILHQVKYAGRTSLLPPLGAAMSRHVLERLPLRTAGLFVPVPLHPGRKRVRGFNQSEALASAAAGAASAPVDPRLLTRARDTRPQARLPRPARARNVRGAFRLRSRRLAQLPERVVVVDDVVTTGATVGECARLLLAAGAREVCVLSLA